MTSLFLGVEAVLRSWHTPHWLFLATFAIQSIPFNPIPNYLPIALYVVKNAKEPLGLTSAVLLSALGAVLGKLVVLKFGDLLKRLMPRRSREAFKELLEMVPEDKLDLAVFVVAVSPLPDDEVYLLLRAGDYSAKRLLFLLLPAKLVWALVHVVYALATYRAVEFIAGDAAFWAYMAFISALTFASTVVALRLDWASVLDAYKTGGIKSAVAMALRSAVALRRGGRGLRGGPRR